MHQPVGPCLFITPWNFPMAMGTRKIGPAIAAGCTMVVKPAKQTPLSMLALAEILEQAGLPAGVLNVVTSSSASRAMGPLIADRRARKLSFTGSTEVGRTLVEQSARQLLRVSMELGGNAPFLVFADADIDEAVEGAMLAKMRNIGEACTAANRFHVHESVADDFSAALSARMSRLTVGRGTEPGVDVGPLIDAAQRDKVAELVDDAVDKGAKLLTGGKALDGPGYFYQPDRARLRARRRAPAARGDLRPGRPGRVLLDDDEAIAANDTEYGLVAYVYTNDLRRALRVGERLQTGHGRPQPGHRVQRRRTLRRRQAVGLRARGRLRGHRGVPGDEVRGDRPLKKKGDERKLNRNYQKSPKIRGAGVRGAATGPGPAAGRGPRGPPSTCRSGG